ncbi:MAG: cytochrome c family protein [Rhodospirillaceae bacterium]
MQSLKYLLAAASLVASSFAAQGAQTASQAAKLYGDAGRGREVVARWCGGCHSLGATQDDRIPSFPALARNAARSEGAIRAFLMQPHKPMPPLEISTQQIEDIVAYLRSLQPAPGP